MLKKICLIMLCLFISTGCGTGEAYTKVNSASKIIDINFPVVALTFDDGPSKYTVEILELLKEYDAHATFFVVGNKVNTYSNTINSMIKYGNEIGNHSYSHKWLSRISKNSIIEEISLTQNILKNVANYEPTLLRPTYGGVNQKVRSSTDLKIVLWDVDTKDWKLKSSETIAKRALATIEDEDIVLMHDVYERSLNALKIIIPTLKDKGYQFVTVSELEEIKKIRKKLKE